MKKFKVNPKDYALFEYDEYLDRNANKIPRPKELTYDLGDVVYHKEDNSIGVVLGCVSQESEDLRTDMFGMACFSQIEFATEKHFKKADVKVCEKLRKELGF